mgnify:CR=1 FL=1
MTTRSLLAVSLCLGPLLLGGRAPALAGGPGQVAPAAPEPGVVAMVEPSTMTGCPGCTSSPPSTMRSKTMPSAGASMRAKRALKRAASTLERATL